MFKGVLFALAACFIWGLIFIIPEYISGFDSFEIALGRHFINGFISCLFLILQGGVSLKIFNAPVWKKAFLFSLICNIGYYTCLVISIKYASPAIAALIVELAPLSFLFMEIGLQKVCQYKLLIHSGSAYFHWASLYQSSNASRRGSKL